MVFCSVSGQLPHVAGVKGPDKCVCLPCNAKFACKTTVHDVVQPLVVIILCKYFLLGERIINITSLILQLNLTKVFYLAYYII